MSSDTPTAIVEQAYDNIAEWYLEWSSSQPHSPRERYTHKLLSHAPRSPSILELGCGPGVPITRMLLDHGAQVSANDISTQQLRMAKQRCPEATFLTGDMAALSFTPGTFDGVVSFFTLFHLPRSEQRRLLHNIHTWLKPGGIFVFNLATLDEAEIHGEMLGHGMFWSSFGTEENRAMVGEVGFEVMEVEVLEAGEGKLEESDADYGVQFMWWAVRKGELERA